jgi:hypothetical protein
VSQRTNTCGVSGSSGSGRHRGGGVGAGVTGAQQPGQGFPAGDLRAIQKRQQRVVTIGFLPGRGSAGLVVGVIDDQGGVDVDV